MVTLPNRSFSVSREAQDFDLAPFQALELVLEVSNVLRLAAAATAGRKDAATPGEELIATAATAGQKDAATPLEQRSEDPEHARIRHEVQDQGEGGQQGPLATRGCPRFQYLLHRPGTRRRCQRSDPSECTQPCPLAPFFHQEVLEDRQCGSQRR